MWSKNKKILLLCIAGVLVLAAAVFLVAGLLIPYRAAKNTMDPNGILTVLTQDDGALLVQWPAGENAGTYELQVLERDGEVLHSCTTSECEALLPELPADREVMLRVASGCDYGIGVRKGEAALEATVLLSDPQISDLQWEAMADIGTVTADFDMSEGNLCRVYMTAGAGEPVMIEEVQEGTLKLPFGAGEKYDIPAYDEPLHFTFRLGCTGENVIYLGSATAGFTLTREDLLGTVLNVTQTDNGENSYTFTWNETKGAYYDVRLSDDGGVTWMTMAYIPADKERTYTTPNLTAYTDYSVSIVAVGGQTMPGSEFAAVSETIELHTGPKLIYSTIWPLMDQTVYADPEATQELGTVAAGSAWCVLGMEGRYLKIQYQGQDAYIDSDYCMINLPEYLGKLCLYNITNSYSSIYTVHEYGISKVSGKVINGYENVQISQDGYVVPLLFPTAQKLLKAGEAAKEQGYTLKIYDSYRPQNATNQIYQRTAAILDNAVPAYTYSGKTVRDLSLLDWDPYEEEEEPEEDSGSEEPAAPPATEAPPPAEEPAETTPPTESQKEDTPPTEEVVLSTLSLVTLDNAASNKAEIVLVKSKTKAKTLTYEILMTNNGEYSLGKFLAPGTSRHNFGVALDLTLVDSNGRELSMQTSMHDLSWYSAFKRNNANANTLYKFMSGAGMTNISSEWWHYQDNEIYEKNTYKPLKEGVSLECWVASNAGWRYRLADGSFYAQCTQTIDGQSYTFDENGYLVQ